MRTSYDVFAEGTPSYTDSMTVSFDMAIYPDVDPIAGVGYVMRFIADGANRRIFNVYVDCRGDNVLFRFIEESKNVIISLPVDKDELVDSHWFDVSLRFDLREGILTMNVNGVEASGKLGQMSNPVSPGIVFGKSDYFIDVPAMAINTLGVSGGGDRSFTFPFNEREGEAVHDSAGKCLGHVENAVWLINESYNWRKVASMASSKPAGSVFDPAAGMLYYFNNDSIYTLDTSANEVKAMAFSSPCPVPLFLANSFIDPGSGRLYVYEAVAAEDAKGAPTVASLDLTDMSWRVESDKELEMQLHHHDYIYCPSHDSHIIFGGFGNMLFSNRFRFFDMDEGGWKMADTLTGDRIEPRYFSAVGYSPDTHSAYVFGGMGNESGEQIVGRRYFYDLYRVDIATNHSTRLWEMADDLSGVNTVPARGMVMEGDTAFCVLRYPESVSSSHLKLYRFGMADGRYEVLGDSIPIWSDKITTNAHLYYCSREGRLYAVVQESEDDISSTLTVYSLAYPAVSRTDFFEEGRAGGMRWLRWVVAALLLVGGALTLDRLRRRKKDEVAGPAPLTSPTAPRVAEPAAAVAPVRQAERPAIAEKRERNAVYLFGDFSVYSKEGRDITYMFTARPRQIFCLTLQYSDREGISSNCLSSLLWPDKEKDKVKNSRGVAVNHLRKVLAELNGVELRYDSGLFSLVTTGEDFYCDYLECVRLLADEESLRQNRRRFLDIISRGKFLRRTDEPVFDEFKQQVEVRLEGAILDGMKDTFKDGDYTLSLEFAEAAFNIDPLNETVLSYAIRAYHAQKRENDARALYRRFAEEYRRTTGEHPAMAFGDYWG